MKTAIYPAVFHKEEDGTFSVDFPDLDGCFTYGESLEQAFNMAGDALFAWTDAFDDLPAPTDLAGVEKGEDDIVLLVKAAPYEEVTDLQKKKVAKAIEDGLKAKGLSRTQTAQILDVNRSYIAHIVNGDKTPSPDFAKRLALLLGFDWQIFFAGNGAN